MNHRKLITLAALAFATNLLVMAAHADSGIYVGGGAGKTNMEDSAGNSGGVQFDESSAALKLFAGYHLDFIPQLKFAAEVGYRDLGRPSSSLGGVDVEYRAHGFDYGVLAGLGLGPVDLFGRVGRMNTDCRKLSAAPEAISTARHRCMASASGSRCLAWACALNTRRST